MFGLLRKESGLPSEPGLIDGKHFTEYVDRVKSLKREGRNQEAINMLLRCADAAEEEGRENGHAPAPWYFEQLAIVYRKEGRIADEVAVLERYLAQVTKRNYFDDKLADRLDKAKRKLNP